MAGLADGGGDGGGVVESEMAGASGRGDAPSARGKALRDARGGVAKAENQQVGHVGSLGAFP